MQSIASSIPSKPISPPNFSGTFSTLYPVYRNINFRNAKEQTSDPIICLNILKYFHLSPLYSLMPLQASQHSCRLSCIYVSARLPFVPPGKIKFLKLFQLLFKFVNLHSQALIYPPKYPFISSFSVFSLMGVARSDPIVNRSF
jgi:hypothetical protein